MTTIRFYDHCVARALGDRGIDATDFANTSLRVYHRATANPRSVVPALAKGGIIIPAVLPSLFGEGETDLPVATILQSVDDSRNEARVYNPFIRKQTVVSADTFLASWHQAGGLCTTAFPDDGTFRPKLLDLSHISLPDDLDALCEAMARNAHDTWAMERQSEGWTYGPSRSDQLLQTPDMVAYEDLEESEKQYDRIMAADTLKLLIALGYRISPQ